jgi:hypothetical protein
MIRGGCSGSCSSTTVSSAAIAPLMHFGTARSTLAAAENTATGAFASLVARLPHPLASGALRQAHVPVGSVWRNTFLDRVPDPLGFGFASSRLSDPRREPANRFGGYYVGQTFEVVFLETIVRDLRNGNPSPLILSAKDLDEYVHVPVTVQARLNLIDLRGGNAVAPGVPTNTVRASSHRRGQRASLAVYQCADLFDAIWCLSRLNGDESLAMYGRAVAKLFAGVPRKLGTLPEVVRSLERTGSLWSKCRASAQADILQLKVLACIQRMLPT